MLVQIGKFGAEYLMLFASQHARPVADNGRATERLRGTQPSETEGLVSGVTAR